MRISSLVLGGCALLALSGCDWLKSGTTKDNVDEPTELVDIEESTRFDRLWSTGVSDDKGRSGGGLRPAVAGGRAFVAGSGGELEALLLESGKRLWRAETETRFSGGPASDGRRVVIGGLDGEVHAYDGDDGEQLWQVQLSSEVIAAPLVTPSVVVVRTNDGRAHGLAATDGSVRWTYDASVPLLTLRGNASPVLDGEAVILAGDNGKVVALNLEDGKLRWEQAVNQADGRNELERLIDIDGQVRSDRGDIFLGAYNGSTMALVGATGQQLWSIEAPSASGIDISERMVVVAESNGVVRGLDRRSGGELWKQEALKFRLLGSPLVVGTQVLVGDLEGYLHALDIEDGRLTGRTRVGKRGLSGPAQLADGIVVAQDKSGRIAAYRVGAR